MKEKTNTVGFLALIKDVHSRSLVSGDKSTRIVLEVDNPENEMIDKLNRLHRADQMVAVGVSEYLNG